MEQGKSQMDIRFSRHAKRQMKWRDISEQEARDTLLSPEKVEDSIKNRMNAFKHIGDKWLKVTFKEDDKRVLIITAIDRNK